MISELFGGRINRANYFIYVFGYLPLALFAGLVTDYMFLLIIKTTLPFTHFVLYFLLFWLIVLSIKRLNDINLSGLYVLVPLFLGAGLISRTLFGFIATSSPFLGFLYLVATLLLCMGTISFLLVKRGTIGPNKYGEEQILQKRERIVYWLVAGAMLVLFTILLWLFFNYLVPLQGRNITQIL